MAKGMARWKSVEHKRVVQAALEAARQERAARGEREGNERPPKRRKLNPGAEDEDAVVVVDEEDEEDEEDEKTVVEDEKAVEEDEEDEEQKTAEKKRFSRYILREPEAVEVFKFFQGMVAFPTVFALFAKEIRFQDLLERYKELPEGSAVRDDALRTIAALYRSFHQSLPYWEQPSFDTPSGR